MDEYLVISIEATDDPQEPAIESQHETLFSAIKEASNALELLLNIATERTLQDGLMILSHWANDEPEPFQELAQAMLELATCSQHDFLSMYEEIYPGKTWFQGPRSTNTQTSNKK